MVEIKEEVDHEIWWQVRRSSMSFWFDNWTKLEVLYFIVEQGKDEEIEVRNFIVNGEWDRNSLESLLDKDFADHITNIISPSLVEEADIAWWMAYSHGHTTTKSTFQGLRRKKEEVWWLDNIWIKGVPFKFFFSIESLEKEGGH